MKRTVIFGIAAMVLSACSHHSYIASNGMEENKGSKNVALGYSKEDKSPEMKNIRKPLKITGGKYVDALPNATAFRMSGDYSNNVAVTLSPQGELLYFPAPSDITAYSAPQELVDGWWLNNQGLGPNSVFTKYTFAEYAALPDVPSPEQIKMSVIPGAKVTQFIELPMKVGETRGNLEEVKAYLKNE